MEEKKKTLPRILKSRRWEIARGHRADSSADLVHGFSNLKKATRRSLYRHRTMVCVYKAGLCSSIYAYVCVKILERTECRTPYFLPLNNYGQYGDRSISIFSYRRQENAQMRSTDVSIIHNSVRSRLQREKGLQSSEHNCSQWNHKTAHGAAQRVPYSSLSTLCTRGIYSYNLCIDRVIKAYMRKTSRTGVSVWVRVGILRVLARLRFTYQGIYIRLSLKLFK